MKKNYVYYGGLFLFSYMALGMLMPLIGQYLYSIGFNGTQIGIITASGTFVAVFASAVWGTIYHRMDKRPLLVLGLCAAAAVTGIILKEIPSFLMFVLGYGFLYFFQAPIMAFSDAITLEAEQPFHKIRKWGAAGFAAGVFIAGRIAQELGLDQIFYLYAISFFISAVMLFVISNSWRKKTKDPAINKTDEQKGYKVLLSDKKLMQLILCIFFMGGTNVANNTYFSFLYLEGGGTIAGVGLTMLFMVGSEAPFMQWSAKLSQRFTMEKTILGAMILSVVRFIIYGIGPSHMVLAVTFFLQGAVNGIVLVEFVRYVSKLAPEGYEGLAIAIYYAIGSNGSTIVCQLIGETVRKLINHDKLKTAADHSLGNGQGGI